MILFLLAVWLITHCLYQEMPLWRTPQADATAKVVNARADHLDVHKARDALDQRTAAGR